MTTRGIMGLTNLDSEEQHLCDPKQVKLSTMRKSLFTYGKDDYDLIRSSH